MKATCVIADDEPLAVQLLQQYLHELGTLHLIGTCSSAMEVINMLRRNQVDLLFLDIQMPKLTGIELLKILKNPPAVIITTAHREYALEGYDLDVVDYLLKPITFDRFIAAVERYYTRKKTSLNDSLTVSLSPAENLLLLKLGSKSQQINTQAVLYLESLKDHIKIHFEHGKKLIVKYKISQLENELPSEFIRVHKSFIVNSRKVTVFSASQLEIGDICIPVGHSYKTTVKMFLNGL
ncbi:DNA-binding response regulator [Sinomicrobium pectinilyticum]|uniref:DNA-binding response regulator n=1 Tax=Sinomicrobium pectinilyticum TaxID=1084421 RepID=A0A3N0EEN0_SINP1|nr:response regulator transcription factor [Sinomicrobium pectinilyticum]RNL86293.1 DNA-binding response regulator [Sinomicrobium pectinilyticum]